MKEKEAVFHFGTASSKIFKPYYLSKGLVAVSIAGIGNIST